ncbi:hypothetical protein F5879DRAFT_993844 [Lentinula edodes]|nr:hypothetical protein F5879DRAFT_993844 [Lentinula edodes]
MEKIYGAPYMHIHRQDLLQLLVELASPYAEFILESAVTSIDPMEPSVTLLSGRTIKAHVIVAADGINNTIRKTLFPHSVLKETGNIAYRSTVPVEVLKMTQH